jgi:hypothetical protein
MTGHRTAGDAVSWREPGADGMLIVRCDSVRYLGVRADNGADGRGAGWSDAMKLKGSGDTKQSRSRRAIGTPHGGDRSVAEAPRPTRRDRQYDGTQSSLESFQSGWRFVSEG